MLTPRQERFCLNLLVCNTQTEAAFLAGYALSHAHVQASQNLRKPKIRKRVEELRRTVSKRTLEEHIAELEKIKSEAKDKGHTNTLFNAEKAIGQVSGLYVEQHKDITDDLSDEQLILQLKDQLGKDTAIAAAKAMGLAHDKIKGILDDVPALQ